MDALAPLTPSGWVRGSEKLDFGEKKVVDPPKDRVCSYRYMEEMASRFSPAVSRCNARSGRGSTT
jgi:hypothetical protein